MACRLLVRCHAVAMKLVGHRMWVLHGVEVMTPITNSAVDCGCSRTRLQKDEFFQVPNPLTYYTHSLTRTRTRAENTYARDRGRNK